MTSLAIWSPYQSRSEGSGHIQVQLVLLYTTVGSVLQILESLRNNVFQNLARRNFLTFKRQLFQVFQTQFHLKKAEVVPFMKM